jgi:hypothetical protein
MKSNTKPYINTEIFLDYYQAVFRPNLAEFRRLDEFADEMTVLLIDNYSSHITSDVTADLTKALVRVMTFAPHATEIFQFLDVTKYELPFGDERATVKFIMKVYHDFKQTMVEPTISRAFQALEFEFDTTSEPYRLFFNEEKLTKSAGFRGLWSIDFPLDQLCCQFDGVILDLVGLISQSKMTWLHYIFFPLIRDQDVILCQESEKWKCREIHRISSRELQKSRLLTRD